MMVKKIGFGARYFLMVVKTRRRSAGYFSTKVKEMVFMVEEIVTPKYIALLAPEARRQNSGI